MKILRNRKKWIARALAVVLNTPNQKCLLWSDFQWSFFFGDFCGNET
jgi:hypothetical protein